MGYELSWLAVPTSHEALALNALGLSCNDGDEPFAPTMLGHHLDWSIIIEESFPAMSLTKDNASKISVSCPVVLCSLNEHSMESRASLWDRSHAVWDILHISEIGDRYAHVLESKLHLVSIKELGQQDRTKLDTGFDKPLDAAEKVTGFRYGRLPEHTIVPLYLRDSIGSEESR